MSALILAVMEMQAGYMRITGALGRVARTVEETVSGASMKMTWGGLTKLVDAPARVTGAVKRAARAIGEMLVSSTQQRFEDGKGSDGKPWKPSARATSESGQTLVDTGRLRASIGYQASDKAVVVGTNAVYGAIHQFGGEAGRGHKLKLPARPYLGISKEDRAEAKAILEGMMARILAGGGK